MSPRICRDLLLSLSLLILILSLFSAPAGAAFWERKYDAGPRDQAGCPECSPDDFDFIPSPVRARHAVAVRSGASWITGRSYDGISDNVLTVKYNDQGTVLWARQWDGGADDLAFSVAVDDLGNAYVVGTTWQETPAHGPQAHLLLLKYDASGNLLWSRTFRSGIWTWGIDLLLIDGRPYLAAESYSGDSSIFTEVLRYSADGALEWARPAPSFGFEDEEKGPIGLATDGLGHVYLAGWLYKPGFADVTDTFVVKHRTDGQELWAARHDSGGQDVPWGVSADGASRVFVTGPGGTAGWDSSGTLLWDTPFTGTPYAVLAHEGSVYVTGTDGRMRTVRYDAATGAEIWTHLEDQNGANDTGYALGMANGTLFVAGKIGSPYGTPDQDLLMIGIDSATSTLRYILGGGGGGDDLFYALATSPGRVWAAGQSNVEGNDNFYLLSDDSVLPLPRLTDLKLTPINFPGGCQSPTGRITLDRTAPAGGTVVTLTNTNPVAVVPSMVTVPEGQSQVTFPITAPAVTQVYDGMVTASAGGGTDSSSLKVRPIAVQVLTLSANPVTGPGQVNAAVFLECPAAPGDVVVKLSSSNAAVAWPSAPSIVIPAGATTGRFTISTADVAATQFVDIRANTAGGGKIVRLQVN
ncbi:MAG TPA: SBBP repeat-containing protein [Thermoanaerobaculia bacterium]